MHIAMLSGEYPPRWGGMGSTVFHLAGALVKMGHRVTVITRRDKSVERNPRSIPQQDGVAVLSVRWAPLPMAFTVSYGKWALRELMRVHGRDAVDAVHVHAPMISWKEKQYRLVRERIGPVITSLHGSWLGERDGMTRAAKHGESAVWKNPNDLAILLTAKYYAKYERAAVRASVDRSTDANGRVTEVNPMMSGLQNMMGGSPMKQALKEVGFEVSDEAMTKTFEYCEFCLKQVVADNEMVALLEGLDEKGYGKPQLSELTQMVDAEKSDLYDVLAYIAFTSPPLTREERVAAHQDRIFSIYRDNQQEFLRFVLDQYVKEGVGELDLDLGLRTDSIVCKRTGWGKFSFVYPV